MNVDESSLLMNRVHDGNTFIQEQLRKMLLDLLRFLSSPRLGWHLTNYETLNF